MNEFFLWERLKDIYPCAYSKIDNIMPWSSFIGVHKVRILTLLSTDFHPSADPDLAKAFLSEWANIPTITPKHFVESFSSRGVDWETLY